ncbi:PREDICTED: G protein-regulated inducer of neurite outgrowth 1 [Cyprinodon variegatus]|uniref:G protein regulated inducer of neurite outgrowth 1 n=1 Tax=Cyprinodon variegatus TaxID=28743 RepID=A0A3Q2GJ76_CYPVA|nr:PREDICTED: G protein-regulated inducer of neurite outgrowth 1 [Cyprinodon variegatus]
MGSLKDEKRSLRDDQLPCEKTNNEGLSVGSNSGSEVDGSPLRTCQESTSLEDRQSKLQTDAGSDVNTEKHREFKDPELSGVDCESTAPAVSDSVKDSVKAEAKPVTLLPVATESEATISINIQDNGDADRKIMALGNSKGRDTENIFVCMPSTPGPSDPRSPAPFGQQHMRTQVSLEVVQCCSAATSPMTPPEGDHSFFFPSSFGKHQAAATSGTKDAELQVGQQVEFCSVATSPMTPKTPSSTAFPVLVEKRSFQEKSLKTTKCTGETSPKDGTLKSDLSNEMTESLSPNKSVGSSTIGLATTKTNTKVTFEDNAQQCKQQRMGSMDQDITILVTHYGNNQEEGEEKAESHFQTLEPEMVKIEETDGGGQDISNIKSVNRKEPASTVAPDHAQEKSSPKQNHKLPEGAKICTKAEDSKAMAHKAARDELKDVSIPKSPVPESPAPFGCHNIRTQVSLEVVHCQSVATSPMTPPEGDQAFYFPSSLGKCREAGTETKDAELQVGQQVEFRSIATAPMTPRTPVATIFPDIKKEESIEEEILEEKEEEQREQVTEHKKEALKEEEKLTQKESVEGDTKEAINCTETDEEKSEEPVQEVNWDEKGMTWDVYGAVVEVAVLGTAIQKHLEKQVQKQKQLSSMPPPPPLNPSATPLPSDAGCGGSGKRRGRKKGEHDGKASRRRRNPFRLLMENVQQPHCCSKAHTNE